MKKFKTKFMDILGYTLFIIFFILAIPLLAISGAIRRPQRFYKYIADKVHNKTPYRYFY